jgi:hypothetical protein
LETQTTNDALLHVVRRPRNAIANTLTRAQNVFMRIRGTP